MVASRETVFNKKYDQLEKKLNDHYKTAAAIHPNFSDDLAQNELVAMVRIAKEMLCELGSIKETLDSIVIANQVKRLCTNIIESLRIQVDYLMMYKYDRNHVIGSVIEKLKAEITKFNRLSEESLTLENIVPELIEEARQYIILTTPSFIEEKEEPSFEKLFPMLNKKHHSENTPLVANQPDRLFSISNRNHPKNIKKEEFIIEKRQRVDDGAEVQLTL